MRRRPHPRRRRPAPTPPPPREETQKPTAIDVERALERRLALQRGMTREVGRTARGYRELSELQDTVSEQVLRTPRYRNPHDRSGEFDRLDRKNPVVLGVPHFALMVPGFIRRLREVPDRAVDEYAEDDDGQYALIECPCGAKPIAREHVEKCPGCERYYFVGKRAIVIYGAMTPPGEIAEPEPEEVRCEHGTCDGSGFIVDEATNTSRDCACRPALIAARRAAPIVD